VDNVKAVVDMVHEYSSLPLALSGAERSRSEVGA
jgi:hypothetical protein